jgi:hypothetical protein
MSGTQELPAPVRRRRRSAAVLLAVSAAAGVAGGVLTAVATSGDGSGSPGAAPASPPASTPLTGVTCWDDTPAATVDACPHPTGRAGLASVFPSLGEDCVAKETVVTGKAEVYECAYDDHLVRYTRWVRGVDRTTYYDGANPGSARDPWEVAGEQAGLQWTSYAADADEDRRYQWSASYADAPYSVSVEARSDATRDAAKAEVEARPPDEIGLS